MRIEKFPHAFYDPSRRMGYLAHYYPWDAVKDGSLDKDLWRRESYSPEILNFKEGRDEDIKRFVVPFIELIHYALSCVQTNTAFLIPVPSSLASNDQNFSSRPRDKGIKGHRNRDNRNSVFCNLLNLHDDKLKVADILVRTRNKPEKETWDAARHAQSLSIREDGVVLPSSVSSPLVLVDDVTTNGGTLEGAKILLDRHYQASIIICTTLGISRSPDQFVGLTSSNMKI